MTQPPTTPGPDEPSGEPQPPSGFAAPSGDTGFAPPSGPGAAGEPLGPPPGSIPPVPPVVQHGGQYDPSQAYVVYQAAPTGGYGVPVAGQQAGFDPLISPDYSGWWQRSLTIFRGAWRQLLVLQLVGFLAGLIVAIPEALYGIRALDDFMRTAGAAGPGTTPDFAPLFGVFAVAIGSLVAGTLVAAAVAVAANHIAVSVAAGQPPRLGAALGLAVRRCLPLWGWQLLASLIMIVGFCACILPGIYLYAVFLVLPAVVTFERGGAGIGRCFQLFHRDFGSAIARVATIAGLLFMVGVVAYVISRVLDLAFPADAPVLQDSAGFVVATATATAVIARAVVSGLLSAGVRTLIDVLVVTAYADMRARHEPLSTATLAAEIGITPTPRSEWLAPPA
ncbi:hypothetical protein ABT297_06190 [Dactylosporangium sp. NPDC000555]|uniref:hypothetical protein n=1 Tax=Dactylosporangium sp. NPDC000555 TaxID=3154260 RepID=UPI00332ABD7C